jgi:hypothetical protein
MLDSMLLRLAILAASITTIAVGARASQRKRPRKEHIPGGLASGMKPADFNQRELHRGTEVELEHSSDRRIAREVAMDHLVEDPAYYKKLKRAGL